MNHQFDELTKSLAQSVTRRAALKRFGLGLTFIALARIGLVILTFITVTFTTEANAQGGIPLWTNRYHGPGNSQDIAYAVAVDGSGNVFVTGTSGPHPFLTDFVTVAYSATGVPLWTNRYDGPGNGIDETSSVAVDGSGNVIVTGSSVGSGGFSDYATIKYSGKGVPLWTNRYNGPENSDDDATALAVDGSSNIIVTGISYRFGVVNPNYATIKYSNAGVPIWTNRYIGPFSDDRAQAVALDGSGNVFVTGSSADINGYFDYATVAYSSAGAPLWTNRYHGPEDFGDYAQALAVDGSGNVVVTGNSSPTSGNDLDYAAIKYSGAGVPLWTNYSESADHAVEVDSSGNVIKTGYSLTGSGDNHYATIAYSNAGVPLWTNRYPLGQAVALAIDASGNVVVTGYSYNGTNYDYVTIKYSGAPLQSIPLNYQIAGNQLVLVWTNAAFSLQSAPAVQGVYTNIAGATSPYTNSISGAQRYFRLKAN